MKIVIDIPEDDFYMIQRVVEMGIGSSVDKLIYSGTPFPKGHGRLIDADDKTIDKKREFVVIDRVLEIVDKHIKFTQDCNDDISPLMGLRRDIEQMKGGDK